VLKRTFDLVVATVALVLLSPVLVAVALTVLVSMGRPVLFRQVRPGLHGAPFAILKFRTMRPPLRPGGELYDEADRLTRVGKLLRATSLDELPELFNVLRGQMSLVGPRPLLVEYLTRYTPEQARRHLVRPGITGLAQISGRNELDWERRFELDVHYVDHRSFRLDLSILARTLPGVLRRTGISAEGHVTAPQFIPRQAAPAAAEQRTGERAPMPQPTP
jgi:lipopolysaccharide/colanic/teichoic acid biosynthesis glycosyltransferase